jgi:hypothetical protein
VVTKSHDRDVVRSHNQAGYVLISRVGRYSYFCGPRRVPGRRIAFRLALLNYLTASAAALSRIPMVRRQKMASKTGGAGGSGSNPLLEQEKKTEEMLPVAIITLGF